ncbi:unnamed protein product, partial [Discosporangium mesarthrocarpum]
MPTEQGRRTPPLQPQPSLHAVDRKRPPAEPDARSGSAEDPGQKGASSKRRTRVLRRSSSLPTNNRGGAPHISRVSSGEGSFISDHDVHVKARASSPRHHPSTLHGFEVVHHDEVHYIEHKEGGESCPNGKERGLGSHGLVMGFPRPARVAHGREAVTNPAPLQGTEKEDASVRVEKTTARELEAAYRKIDRLTKQNSELQDKLGEKDGAVSGLMAELELLRDRLQVYECSRWPTGETESSSVRRSKARKWGERSRSMEVERGVSKSRSNSQSPNGNKSNKASAAAVAARVREVKDRLRVPGGASRIEVTALPSSTGNAG